MGLDFMKDDGVFLPMLNDTGRNQFYKAAIERAAPGKVVCDVGAGTGLLSILAAKAGATKVIAVEQDSARAEYMRSIIERVGLLDKIEIVNDNFLNTDISADVYVSETFNTQIFGEDMIRLSNHARKHNGVWIPSQFEIVARVYETHPIFLLDFSHSEAYEFSPNIEIDPVFEQIINTDFQSQYSHNDTLYRANQLNMLFPMLPNFTDVTLNQLYETKPVVVDMNTVIDEENVVVRVPHERLHAQSNSVVVLFWKARYQDIVLDCENIWFGNVAKIIPIELRRPNTDVTLKYLPDLRNWQVLF